MTGSLFLGSNFGHGSAVAAISGEGQILGAVEEGRLIGEKDSSRFPSKAMEWVTSLGHDEGRLAGWAEGWRPLRRLISKGFSATLRYGWRDESYLRQRLLREVRRYLDGRGHFETWSRRLTAVSWVGHHLAHAYSLLPAGLPDKSLVLVSDTTGEWESISTFYWSGAEMTLLSTSPFPHSIGGAFHRLAHHLGFYGRTGPGKLMALAAYGEPVWKEELRRLGEVREGVLRLDLSNYPAWHRSQAWLRFASSGSNLEFKREVERSRFRYEEGLNLASSVQAWFTETTWDCILQAQRIAWDRHRFETEHLGLVGGSALNCRANGDLVRRAPSHGFGSVTISPWSSDPGTAIGAAVAAWLAGEPEMSVKCSGPLLGPVAQEGAPEASEEAVRKAAVEIARGSVVAFVSGRLEFGPRALGGRCLLADPRKPEMRDCLNRMKGRPHFMPVAPAVLAEDYKSYFIGVGSRSMGWTVEAREFARRAIPAAVHQDGTSRVQVVRAGEPPLLDRLLRTFREYTGHGVLLLTSLNGAGEAIPASLSSARTIATQLGAGGLLCDSGWCELGPSANP